VVRRPEAAAGIAPSASFAWTTVLASLALLSLFVLALIAFRILYTGTAEHVAIAWNLFLAWIPFVLALVVHERGGFGSSVPRFVVAGVLWLLFLPNAPYIVTDLKYVGRSGRVPVLYDVLLLFAAAWAGLLLGLTSLFLMHAVARRLVGALKAWSFVVGVLAVSSFGIYLGRLQRWNSWDVLVRPGPLSNDLAHAVLHPLGHPRPLAMTVLFTSFLLISYLVLYSFATRASALDAPPSAGRARRAGERRAHEPAAVTRRPRLLMLITLAETGGAQTYVTLLLPGLAERFDVTLAARGCGPLRDAARAAGVRFVPLEHVRRAINPWRDARGLVELVRLCRRERPDIAHANSSKAGILGRLAALLARVPIRVFTAHGWAFAAYRGLAGRLYLWGDRLVRPLTTLVICVAERERELGVRARTCTPKRTAVVRNAVDVSSFAESRHAGEPPQLIAVSRFAYPKDFVTLVEALAAVDVDYRAVFVGDGPERPAVVGELRRRGLSARVELLGERNDVPELLASSDLFVLSSRSEGLPVSVLEAMAASLPVVATDVGGVGELVVHGTTGLLVPPGDAGTLGKALERLLRERNLRRRLGTAARRRAEHEFDLPRWLRAHVDLYRRELELRGLPLPEPDASSWAAQAEAGIARIAAAPGRPTR
jgi:glycosyltransferase involved in cell wall biosynthesis/uncharacterized membrane protein